MAKNHNKSVSPQPISTAAIWLASIASTLVVFVLVFAWVWFEDYIASNDFSGQGDAWLIFFIFVGIVFLPSIIVAIILLPKLMKK